MCFRPATAEPAIDCPVCGKKVRAVMGTIPNVCPFCEADITAQTAGINAGAGVPIIAPGATTPAAPGAPAAPKAPQAPNA